MASRARPVRLDENFTWVALETAQDGYFEARHMRNSIGHSCEKYAALGQLFSLRAPDGLPVAPVMAQTWCIIHAREHQNARLGPVAEWRLARFAESLAFELVEDYVPFDVWSDGAAPNTEVRFCRRDGLQDKVFARTVLRGVLNRQDAADLAAALGGQQSGPVCRRSGCGDQPGIVRSRDRGPDLHLRARV